MTRTGYAWLLRCASPLLLLYLAARALLDRRYRDRWWQRFGFVPRPASPIIWVHAVSVGEALAAVPLVRALRDRHPGYDILMTTVTPTGAEVVRQRLQDMVTHVYAPYDLPGAVQRFLKRTRPVLGIIMETEVWPNLYHYAARRKLPIALVNARLSDRSSKGYRRFAQLIGPALGSLSLIAAQSEADAARFRALGASQVYVTGNLKFDLPDQSDHFIAGRFLRNRIGARPVWVFGSTHAGEETLAIEVMLALQASWPDLLLILVPRHPQRFEEVAELLNKASLPFARRSRDEIPASGQGVLLGDTLGELSIFYAAADLVTVGGSFTPVGGHNLLEAAALGRPVSFGPHMHNFREISAKILAAEAGRQVADKAALITCLQDWFVHPDEARALGQRGIAVVEANRGALQWTLQLLPLSGSEKT